LFVLISTEADSTTSHWFKPITQQLRVLREIKPGEYATTTFQGKTGSC